jgi:hypothetical protein
VQHHIGREFWLMCLRAPRGLENVRPHAAQRCNSETSQTVVRRTCRDVKSCETIARRLTLRGASRRSWAPRNVTLARGSLATEWQIVEEGGSIDALPNN